MFVLHCIMLAIALSWLKQVTGHQTRLSRLMAEWARQTWNQRRGGVWPLDEHTVRMVLGPLSL